MKENVDVEQWYRHEVLSNPELYPSLYKIEIAKNKYRFEQNKT